MFTRSALVFALCSSVVLAQSLPTTDRQGSKDHPLLKRYEGSVIVAYEHKSFAEFTLPLSPLEPASDDAKPTLENNRVYEPKNKKPLEGRYTRIAYLIPPDRSPLEVLRNYQDDVKAQGGKILFECKGAECGGDPHRSSAGGGGDMSLSMYLFPPDRVTDAYYSSAGCVLSEDITDQRYAAAELTSSNAHVSVLTYTVVAADRPAFSCGAFNGRTVAVVDILESKERENRMVTVNADEMAKSMDTAGRVALYGILFDFNKSDVKPESDATLQQIANLLKQSSGLKLLVVGHTDNVGTFSFNMDSRSVARPRWWRP